MTCPAGHETTATDYCDTCGLAMRDVAPGVTPGVTPGATGVPAAAAGERTGQTRTSSDSGSAASTCPNCSGSTPPQALFCENCGYDFTTGALPRPVAPPSPLDLDGPADAVPSGAAPAAPPSTSTSPSTGPAAAAPSADLITSPPTDELFVAEIWIDPDWYADQQSTDPLPSPGLPTVVALRHTSLLIGRASRSRNIDPGIELDSDSGVSRRHAQLTTDGSRWFVEDLGSSNGTYVGGGLGTLPTTPIVVGQKVEVTGDDRIYLGAWTRIVLREAAPGEG